MQYKNGSGGAPMKILIIEDEKLLADSLQAMLREQGL